MNKEAYYFPHDSNAIQDPKMMVLLSECGLSGVGIFWIIIEILHQQESGLITQEEFKKYLSFYYHFQTDGEHLLNKIEQVLIKSKLLLIKDGYITSDRVLKNKKYREDISEKRSFAGKKSGESRSKGTSVGQVLNKTQQGKERKVKEKKGNNIDKKQYLEFVYLTDKEHESLLEKYGDRAKDYIERLNNYIGSKGKKYKSHYHTILTWASKDKPEPQSKIKATL